MKRLLVLVVMGGNVVEGLLDDGEKIELDIVEINYDEEKVYTVGKANNGGAKEYIESVFSQACDDGLDCGAHWFEDHRKEEEK